jgi:hypothetical protein
MKSSKCEALGCTKRERGREEEDFWITNKNYKKELQFRKKSQIILYTAVLPVHHPVLSWGSLLATCFPTPLPSLYDLPPGPHKGGLQDLLIACSVLPPARQPPT